MARELKPSKGRPDIKVRKAKASDRKPLMTFIRGIWGGHDYIPHVWDRWLKDPSGQMFVAEVEGNPVGMNRVKLVEDGSAWFEGARVHPAYRGKGVATALGERSMQYVNGRGARVYRLASRSSNWPAHRQVARMSFKEVARVSVYERGSTSRFGPQTGVRAARSGEAGLLYRTVKRSRELKKSAGLICSSFTGLSLSKELFERRAGMGEVLTSDGAVAIITKGEEGRNLWKEVCFLSGKAAPAARLVKHVLGSEPKKKDVIVFLPVGSSLASTLKGLGFKRSTSLIIFERRALKG